MNTPYRLVPNTSQNVRWYGPFPFAWWSLLVLFFLFVFTWAFWHVAVARERVECINTLERSQCVHAIHRPFQPSVTFESFKPSTLRDVRLEEVVHHHSKGKGVTIKGRLHLVFDTGHEQLLDELSLTDARATQQHFLAFLAGARNTASFDSGDLGWLRGLALLGMALMLGVARWAWTRRAPVQLRWFAETQSLEVIERGFFRATSKRFGVPPNTTFHVKWSVVSSGRSSRTTASLEMEDERGYRTQLTRDRVQGVGVHYQGVLELYRVMELQEPQPIRGPHAPTAGAFNFFSGWFVSLWIGLTCGSLIGMFFGIVVGLEFHLIRTRDPADGTVFLSGAIAGVVALTSLLLFIGHSQRKDLELYRRLTGH